jgi:hypothetical protein
MKREVVPPCPSLASGGRFQSDDIEAIFSMASVSILKADRR